MPEDKENKEEKKDDAESGTTELLKKIMERLDAQDKRLDAMSKKDGENEPTEELKMDSEKEEAAKRAEKEGEKEHKLEKEAEKEGEKEHKEEEKMKSDEKREKDVEFEKDAKKDAKHEEKMDSLKKDNLILKAKLASMEQKFSNFTRELTPEERDELGAAQRRADSVFQMLGENLPAPLAGERPIAYRKRLAARIQKHSDKFKETKLDSLDGAIYDEVERNIYEGAKSAASSIVHAGSGKLIAIRELDATGTRYRTRYVGDSKAGLAPLSARGMTVRINRDLISKGK